MITPAFAVVLLFLTPNVTGYRVDPPHTVTELDFSKYVGKWYQMYTNKRASDLFEKGGECITSSYNLGAEGVITEESTERLNSPTGPKKVIHGNVRTTSVVGQFEVNLDNVPYPVPSSHKKMITPAFAVVLLFLTPDVTGSRVDPPHTVTELDISKYVGKWYQMYINTRAYDLFEKGGQCVTASYSVDTEGVITLENIERLESPTGPKRMIHGIVRTTSVVGQLEVTFDTAPNPAPYWVIKLGPETFGPDKFYEYSVISDNLKSTLFVLARNTTDFKDNYKEDVLKFVQDEGFTDNNKPIETHQGSDCLYNSENAMDALY